MPPFSLGLTSCTLCPSWSSKLLRRAGRSRKIIPLRATDFSTHGLEEMRPLVRLVTELQPFAHSASFAVKGFFENVSVTVVCFVDFEFSANAAFAVAKCPRQVLFREHLSIYFAVRLLFAYHKRHTPPSFST